MASLYDKMTEIALHLSARFPPAFLSRLLSFVNL